MCERSEYKIGQDMIVIGERWDKWVMRVNKKRDISITR